MSFDVLFQRFVDGYAADGGNAQARHALDSHLVRDANDEIIGLRTSDGAADVYGLDEDNGGGFMANHVSGRQMWSLLVNAAYAADFVIMPIGCPVCVPARSLLSRLPTELSEGARVVEDGDELLAVIQST